MRKNSYLEKLRKQKEDEYGRATNRAIQVAKDTTLITLHSLFGFGPKRLKAFSDAFSDELLRWSHQVMDDGNVDQDLVYSLTKREEILREIMGEFYETYEERYRGL